MKPPTDVYNTTYVAADRYSVTLRLAFQMLDCVHLGEEDCLLVPCAGNGAMLDPILTGRVPRPRIIVAVEKNQEKAEYINRHLIGASAIGVIAVAGDFLQMRNAYLPTAIAIAPPLSDHQAIDHIRHAYGMLGPGGRLVSPCADRDLSKVSPLCASFAAFLDDKNARILSVRARSLPPCDLPAQMISLTKT